MKTSLFSAIMLGVALAAVVVVSAYRASFANRNAVNEEGLLPFKKVYEQEQIETILFEQPLDPARDGEYRIGIKCTGGVHAILTVYVAKNRRYEPVLQCPATIGRNGPCKQAEGDSRTPLGSWVCGQALGIKPDPGSKIPYTQVTEDMYWRGDGSDPLYNTLVYKSDAPEKDYSKDEHLIEYGIPYHYILDMGYNAGRAPYAGSAIFLHCWEGPDHGTHGCVGVEEENMVKILQTIAPGTVITVY